MKYIITEQQYNKLFKSGPALNNAIINYLEKVFSDAKRKVTPKSRNYGNLREDWCKDGKEIMSVHYYFGEPDGDNDIKNKDFYNGQIYISQSIINTIKKLFNIREKYILNVVAEWYDDEYVQAFATEMDEPYLHIDDAEALDKDYPCAPDIEVPENISDEEMIDYIVKNTLWRRDEVMNMINNGERDLKDFYLDILETVDSKNRYGF
jgi:hypothetical protein